jgi:hypothetical protein
MITNQYLAHTSVDTATKVVTLCIKNNLEKWSASVSNLIPDLNEDSIHTLKNLALEFDWSGVESESSYYLNSAGDIAVFPESPGVNYLFNWDTKNWEPSNDFTAQWLLVWQKQRSLLNASDWIVIRAVDTNMAVPAAWATYRQALRDITNQPDPFNIVWPVAP